LFHPLTDALNLMSVSGRSSSSESSGSTPGISSIPLMFSTVTPDTGPLPPGHPQNGTIVQERKQIFKNLVNMYMYVYMYVYSIYIYIHIYVYLTRSCVPGWNRWRRHTTWKKSALPNTGPIIPGTSSLKDGKDTNFSANSSLFEWVLSCGPGQLTGHEKKGPHPWPEFIWRERRGEHHVKDQWEETKREQWWGKRKETIFCSHPAASPPTV
jgi:hypothetical protein